MTTPANALTGPVWVDAEGNGFVSADGGKTWAAVSIGGGGTIHTSTPLSGDGSVGTPVTIANGAITNVKLATPPQDPAAVAITGGSITGVNTATESVQGAMSAADKTNVDTLSAYIALLSGNSGFYKRATAVIAPAVPAITGYRVYAAGSNIQSATLAATTGDALVEGGGITPANGTAIGFGVSILQTVPSGNWAIGFRAKVGVLPSVAGLAAQFGISDALNHSSVFMGSQNNISTTNFICRLNKFGVGTTDIVSTVTADTVWHDHVVTFDGTTVIYWIDGLNAGSTTTLTDMPTGISAIPYVYNDVTTHAIVSTMIIGYVAP